jgi:glutathione S-transferase
MSLKLYHYIICPFCKPVTYLLDANKVEYEGIHLDLVKGEHKTEEYKKVNPFQKVPAIIEGDFILFESNTVLRYLANTKDIEDNWYPKDPQKRAIVDLYFDWHAANIINLQNFNYAKLGYMNKPLDEAKATTDKAFVDLIGVFLSQRKFVASNDKLTIADLALVYHLAGSKDIGYELPPRADEYLTEALSTSEDLKADVAAFIKVRADYLESKKSK